MCNFLLLFDSVFSSLVQFHALFFLSVVVFHIYMMFFDDFFFRLYYTISHPQITMNVSVDVLC